jgi:lipoprotein-releasing system permease protein
VSDKVEEDFWIVDDSRTKIYQYDANTVYVPFDVLQELIGMRIPGEPARVSTIEVNVKDEFDMYAVLPKVQQIVDDVSGRGALFVSVETWEQANATWIGAVENEKRLVTILFGIISIVAIFLIFCIFYMIVVEKTKDIGIIKSVGATSSGVAGIFLGYGLAIGIVGSAMGLLCSYLIVRYINEIHDWLGRITERLFDDRVQIWNPEVYAFDTIPNTMDPWEVTIILAVAIVASLLGALVPAILAARMNPVEALRWE